MPALSFESGPRGRRLKTGAEGSPPSRQGGIVLMSVLSLVVLIGLASTFVYQVILHDVRETEIIIKRTRAEYAAEAAMYWGLYLTGQPPKYRRITHDSTGNNRITASDTVGNPSIMMFSLTADLSIYPGVTPSFEKAGWEGWVAAAPSNKGESLGGTLNETLGFKAWRPTASKIRVLGRATVEGVSSESNIFADYDY